MIFGGVEAGGTKWVLAVGSSPDDLKDVTVIPTTSPDATLDRVGEFFDRHPEITAVSGRSRGGVNPSRARGCMRRANLARSSATVT